MVSTTDSYSVAYEASAHTGWQTECELCVFGTVGCHQAGGGSVEDVGTPTRDALLHLTTMYYDSEEENSSASASDYDGEFDNDNIDNDNGDNNDNGGVRSNVPYGENLRVRS